MKMSRLFGKDKMTILSASIMQTLEFRDRLVWEQYRQKLQASKRDYSVVHTDEDPRTGKVTAVVRKQYNNNPMEGGETE